MVNKIELSIVILSYNTKDLLVDCLHSLEKVADEADFEVIVVDNNSTDGSADTVRKLQITNYKLQIIENEKNLGFAAGNNLAREYCQSEFILFLNSDTVVKSGTIRETLAYLKNNSEVGALTCKLIMPGGQLDKDARRAFITPWVGLTHLVLHLDKFFPTSKLFARYWYGYISPDEVHETDTIQGAFFLTRKKVLDEVDWFDESYFLDGEDIDICFRIKEKGWRIVYYPKMSIIHIKGASKGKNGQAKKNVSLRKKLFFRLSGVRSMEIFYKKRMWNRYPWFLNILVIIGINLVKLYRVVRTVILG